MIEIDEDNPYGAFVDILSDYVELAHTIYIREITKLAADARRDVVIPMLRSRGWEFRTGNGTWSVTDPAKIVYLGNGKRNWGNRDYDMNDSLPPELDRVLRIEVEGSWGNGELGLWMQDYTLEKTKNGGGKLE